MLSVKKLIFLGSILFALTLYGQTQEILLWDNNIPNHIDSDEQEVELKTHVKLVRNVQKPRLEVFLPENQTDESPAIIICPGGGYNELCIDWEGTDVAAWLNSKGIVAFVLKYRLPNSKSVTDGSNVPLIDAQRAVRMVRSQSEKWKINPSKIGIMGFSAGGHLASTLGTHFDDIVYPKVDLVDEFSARPDFMALIYPVITMDKEFTHLGSRNALIGVNPNEKLINNFSNELQVKTNTPPTFIVHCADDKIVPMENSIQFYKALVDKDIFSEMHIYPKGGHGHSIATRYGHLETWTTLFLDWLNYFNKN